MDRPCRGDRLLRKTEETDNYTVGGRQRRQAMEADRGDRLCRKTEETDN
jgi:hypothetical protein